MREFTGEQAAVQRVAFYLPEVRPEHGAPVMVNDNLGIVDDVTAEIVCQLEAENGILSGPVTGIEPARHHEIPLADEQIHCRIVLDETCSAWHMAICKTAAYHRGFVNPSRYSLPESIV